MVKVLHTKIKELQQRATPINYSNAFVDAAGQLVDFKVQLDDEYILKGYLSVWGVRDSFGTATVRGCFAKSIQERGPKSQSKYKIPLLWQHDIKDPIGQFLELEEDDYGLRFVAQLDRGVPHADRAVIQYGSGTMNQFSYGFDYVWDKMEYKEALDTVLMYEVAMFEGTACTRGSNGETYAVRSVADLNNEMEILNSEIDLFIRSVPRSQQLELRQLFTKHKTLLEIKPDTLENFRATLEKEQKPLEVLADIGGYKLDPKQFLQQS